MPYIAIKNGENKGVYHFITTNGRKIAEAKSKGYPYREYSDEEKGRAMMWASANTIIELDANVKPLSSESSISQETQHSAEPKQRMNKRRNDKEIHHAETPLDNGKKSEADKVRKAPRQKEVDTDTSNLLEESTMTIQEEINKGEDIVIHMDELEVHLAGIEAEQKEDTILEENIDIPSIDIEDKKVEATPTRSKKTSGASEKKDSKCTLKKKATSKKESSTTTAATEGETPKKRGARKNTKVDTSSEELKETRNAKGKPIIPDTAPVMQTVQKDTIVEFMHLLKKYSDMGYSLVSITLNNGEEFEVILHDITYFSLLPSIQKKLIKKVDDYLSLIVDDANNYAISKKITTGNERDKILNYLNHLRLEMLTKVGKDIPFVKVLERTKFMKYGDFLLCNRIGKINCDITSSTLNIDKNFELYNGNIGQLTYILKANNYAIRPDSIVSIKPKTLNYEIINEQFLSIFNDVEK